MNACDMGELIKCISHGSVSREPTRLEIIASKLVCGQKDEAGSLCKMKGLQTQ